MFKKAQFVFGAASPAHMPAADRFEVAMIGRSNCGKSSLINTLLNQQGLARTSKTPGRTIQINFFLIDELFYLCDLPGYGFSRVEKKIQATWDKLLSTYFQRDTPRLYLCLHDIRRDPVEEDWILWEKFSKLSSPMFILTKSDKLNQSDLNKRTASLKKLFYERFYTPEERIFVTSSLKKKPKVFDKLKEEVYKEIDLQK